MNGGAAPEQPKETSECVRRLWESGVESQATREEDGRDVGDAMLPEGAWGGGMARR